MSRNTCMNKKIGRKLLSVLLSVLMMSSLLVFASAEEAAGLETEQAVLVITGSDVLGSAEYTADNIANEKAYTLSELKDLGLTIERLYSAINKAGTKSIYRSEGLDIAALVKDHPDSSVAVVSTRDGFSKTIDFSTTRYYYPGVETDDTTGGVAVEYMLAWKSISAKAPDIKVPGADEMVDHALQLFAGQTDIADVNNSLFVGDAGKLVIGDAIAGTALTALGKNYSRSDVLLMPRAEGTYSYTTQGGERTDIVRGVPLATLLADVEDDAVIEFRTVDNWARISEFTSTKAELVENNAILAYETKGDNGWTSYTRSTDNGLGYFRLMVDGTNGAHAVCEVKVQTNDIFSDLEGYEWAAEAINALAKAEYVSGVGDGKFAPGNTLTRAMIVTILGRVMKAELPTESDGRFPDVESGSYYELYVQWAVDNNIVTGYPDGTFKPDEPIIISHVALLVSRAGLTADDLPELPEGIDFTLTGNANRAIMAVAMYALMQKLG